ncbi:MAG: DNA gyrase subunit A [Nitrospinae bacterium]|nr:DNA gyrase subunit A [Nitrospinota bacterium]
MQLIEQNIPVNIEDEMRVAYLDYAMSVIIGRALPDVRDGLKPVHRRTLYAMYDIGSVWNKPYKKSARIVGDVIGKYHPHGDVAVYDTIVRMAQDFSMRYPLVDGQGNFGSVDGDAAAAMRYTEIRMSQLAQELLKDIEKETVEFGPNYDDSLKEPLVLPAGFPNLLVNGSSGIAVGMATNIPPHNLGEIIDGIVALIDNPDIGVKELMKYIQGPDFPTAGFIYGRHGIGSAYETGRGIIQMRARAFVEKVKKGERESIIIKELPYQVNKARLIEKIAELIRDKKIEGISDIRDESDREGMRIVIELRKGEQAQVILNQLFKQTQMQDSFGVIMIALVNNQPRILNLKEMLFYFVQHRREIVTRRTEFELKKARERAHILEGLKIALEDIDRVIQLIKKSKTPQEARAGLISKFNLDEIQANAILDMKLQRLTGLERQKVIDELKELEDTIKRLLFILEHEEEKLKIIKEELKEIKDKYGDMRRTEIIGEVTEFKIEDLIAEEDMVIAVSHTGYIKRNPIGLYRSQKRGGMGVKAMEVKDEDFVEDLFIASTHSYMMFFSNTGKVRLLKVHEIPQAGRAAKGKAIINLLQLQDGERITAMLSVKEFDEKSFLIMVTERGVVNKTPLSGFSNPRSGGLIAINLDQDDQLIAVRQTDGNKNIFLGTKKGQAIQFKEGEVRVIGRGGRGVKGIELEKNDSVVGMEIVVPNSTILTVLEKGYGKRTRTDEYRVQSRGGKGIINIKITEKNGDVVGIRQVFEEDEIMIVSSEGSLIRLKVKGISVIGRNTQGVKLIDLRNESRVVSIAKLEEKEEE